jgi:hypothetical protein
MSLSTEASGKVTSSTPRTTWDFGCAWQAAVQQPGAL